MNRFLTYLFIAYGCIFSSNLLLAQVNDSFDDGDFTNSPSWSGNDPLFTVDAGELRSASSGAATYYLSTPSILATNAEWKFYFNLKFSTSGANYVDVCLMADNADLSAVTDGMFIRIGGTNDKIVLYKRVSGVDTELISSPNSIVNSSSNNPFLIKVTRDPADAWTLEYDDGNLGTYTSAGSVVDNSVNSSSHFGILVTQSSAASPVGNHFFDDIVVQEIGFDETPPELSSLEVMSENQLKLIFSEEIDQNTAEELSNYILSGSVLPVLETAELTMPNEVILTYASSFENGSYSLQISNIEDLKSNLILAADLAFEIFFPDVPEFRDVIITEIMADASPVVQLPDAEYLELYNNSDKTFDFEGWKLSDATSTVDLPSFIFDPNSRVIICSNANTTLFESYGVVLGVSSLPSLNNSGDNLSLKYDDSLLIDSVVYNNDWYGDEDKVQGGYSLELIDINNVCGGANNWIASVSETGGTPGSINSVNDPEAGIELPSITSISVLDNQHLLILVSEAIDSTSLDLDNFEIDQGIIVNAVRAQYDSVFVDLETPVLQNTEYNLSIATISDCTGNVVSLNNYQLELFVNPEISYRDIIINEIMANPSEETMSPNVEYIEVYNRSDKLINLKDWQFTDGSKTSILPDYFLNPKEYVIVIPASGVAMFEDTVPKVGVSTFPTLNNSGDILELMTDKNSKIDSVAYSSSWYQSTTLDDGGYSLELIDPNNTCNISENWIGSVDNSGGTPGFINSVEDNDSGKALPEVLTVSVNSENEIVIEFSEFIKPESIETNNFVIDPLIEISTYSQENSTLSLLLSSNLVSNETYTVTISGIEDCTGNMINPVNKDFLLFENPVVIYKEVVINEIMANPSVETESPNVEYIELFNNSNKSINLQNWIITDKSRSAMLPYYIFKPESFVVLTDTQNIVEFNSELQILGLSSFPTLNNSGDTLLLLSENRTNIDSLVYTSSWYRSSIKDDGGYSLELIDPDNYCAEELNWTASEDAAGGTPGQLNSVFSQITDNIGPRLENTYGLRTDSIMLIFDEKLDEQSIYNAAYTLSDNLTINKTVSSDLKTIYLLLSDETPLVSGKKYGINIENLLDCHGNIIDDRFNSSEFYLIEQAVEGDILINEILFNPRPNGVDFVELINVSNKYISYKNWLITNGELENDSLIIKTTRTITGNNRVLEPMSYLVLTTNNISLKDQYPKGIEGSFLEIPSLPSLPNDAGLVAILKPRGEVMDYFQYTDDLHADIINYTEGVSLERISTEESTQNLSNWMSAAASQNFATPGYINSQTRGINQVRDGEVFIEPIVIIPDGSGQQDFTTINYSFAQAGNVANVRIFDVQGREVKRIASNDFLSTTGFYTWDGSDESGQRAKIGYYIIYFEVFNANGEVNAFKKKIVIGSKF